MTAVTEERIFLVRTSELGDMRAKARRGKKILVVEIMAAFFFFLATGHDLLENQFNNMRREMK